jgi:hypothetical protein
MKPSALDRALITMFFLVFLGATTIGLSQPRPQPDFRRWIDSLRLKGMPYQMLDDKLKRYEQKIGPRSLKKLSSPQVQICVIDTAIVRSIRYRSTRDTTRHLYLFNPNAKRTSDVTQILKGDL